MKLDEFKKTLQEANPPKGVSPYLAALWFYKKGNWNKAHQIVQDLPDQTASWIHAFLHREEGDLWNADYWYRRANQQRPNSPIEDEWNAIVQALW